MNSIENAILRRIQHNGRGWVCSGKDFWDMANVDAIRQALVRLLKKGKICRVAAGVYYYPKYSKFLQKTLGPDVSLVAHALARKFGWRIQPSGQTALNYLGLSTQVPGRLIYLSNGPNRKYTIGKTILAFERTRLKHSSLKSKPSVLVTQALAALKDDEIDDKVIKKIRSCFDGPTRVSILKETRGVTARIYSYIYKICMENGNE